MKMHQIPNIHDESGEWIFLCTKDGKLPVETEQFKAEYSVRKNWGYRILLFQKLYGTYGEYWEDTKAFELHIGQKEWALLGLPKGLGRNALGRLARKQAREELVRAGCPNGKIIYDGNLLPSIKYLRGW